MPNSAIAARTGSVGTENGYIPASRVSAPSAKKSAKSRGNHGRWVATSWTNSAIRAVARALKSRAKS